MGANGASGAAGFWTGQRRAIAVAVTLVVAAIASVVSIAGCSKDDAAPVRSRRGETCSVSADCADGLACSPVAGVSHGGLCVTADFKLTPTAKECVIIECATTSDCCDETLAAGCERLRELCASEGDAGVDCTIFAQQCGCLTGTVECLGTKCVSHCNQDGDCTARGTGKRCSGGNCSDCILDADCTGGRACVSGKCETGCSNDADCSGFDRCLGNRCIASGCQTDRECVAATRNVDARCGTSGKCIIPCETDLECGSPTEYAFYSCIDKQCTFIGCETDKDCRLLYVGASDASTLPLKQHAVCKDKGVGVVTPTP